MDKQVSKRVPPFIEDLGTVDFVATKTKTALGYTDEDKIQSLCEKILQTVLYCTCLLGFYSYRHNKFEHVIYAKCKILTITKNLNLFWIMLFSLPARMIVSSTDKIKHFTNLQKQTKEPSKF